MNQKKIAIWNAEVLCFPSQTFSSASLSSWGNLSKNEGGEQNETASVHKQKEIDSYFQSMKSVFQNWMVIYSF